MPFVSLTCPVFKQVKAFLQPPIEGIVLETYGSGNAPDKREDLLEELRRAAERKVVILNCTQCLRGAVKTVYATGQVRGVQPLHSPLLCERNIPLIQLDCKLPVVPAYKSRFINCKVVAHKITTSAKS